MSSSKAGSSAALVAIAGGISMPAIHADSPTPRRVIMARNKSGNAIPRDQEVHSGPEAYTPPDEGEARPVAEKVPEPTEVINRSDYFATRLRETVVALYLGANLGRALPQIDTAAYQ